MSGDVVMPHSQSFTQAVSDAMVKTNDDVLKAQFQGAGITLGAIAGIAIAVGIGVATGGLGAVAAVGGGWALAGGGAGWYTSTVTYEVTHSDWYRGTEQREQDNNTKDNLIQQDGITYGKDTNTFHFDVGGGIKMDLFMANSDVGNVCRQINATGTDASEVFGGCDVDNVLNGADGNDKLYGAGGRDTLYGGNGNDLLQDGHGADRLKGNRGADHFDLVLDRQHDTVLDFNVDEHDRVTGFGKAVSFVENWDSYSNAILVRMTNAGGDTIYVTGADWEHNGLTLAEVVAMEGQLGIS